MRKPNLTMPSFKTLRTLLHPTKPQPVFNRPVSTEREYRISRLVHIILLSLMVILAMTLVSLKSMTLAFIDDNENTGFAFETKDSEPVVLAALPRQLYTAPAKLAVVAGVVAFGIGVAHGGAIVWDWRDGKKTQSYAFRRNTMFLHFCNSILILFSLVSLTMTHKSTSHFRERYIIRQADRTADRNERIPGPNDRDGIRYNIGTFDLETWSCELKTVDGARAVWSEYERQCGIEMAGRIVSVPFMVVAFLVAGAMIVKMMRMRRGSDGERLKTEDVGLEMGKFNAI